MVYGPSWAFSVLGTERKLGFPVVLFHPLGEGFPTRVQKKNGYPYSSLSGGPRETEGWFMTPSLTEGGWLSPGEGTAQRGICARAETESAGSERDRRRRRAVGVCFL